MDIRTEETVQNISSQSLKPWEFKEIEKIQNISLLHFEGDGISDIERQSAKVILVLGETGSGKSTLINSLVNYLKGVKLEDPYRFKMIIEPDIPQSGSQTREVNEYVIHSEVWNENLIVIDTPGFGDTRGLKADEEIVNKLYEYILQKCPNIHAICFVAKATLNRVSPTQSYILEKVLSFFSNDAKENIFVMFTFADSKKPPGLDALLKPIPPQKPFPFAKYYKFNNSAFFPEKSLEEDDETNYNIKDHFLKAYWDIGIKSFELFFTDLRQISCVSLYMTQEVIKTRQTLETKMVILQMQITEGLNQMNSINSMKNMLNSQKKAIEENKNFTYDEFVTNTIQVPTKSLTTYCKTCHFTCHNNCAYDNGPQKKSCIAFRDGKCNMCRKQCDWTEHSNFPFLIKTETKKVTKEWKHMKKSYEAAYNKAYSIADHLLLLTEQYEKTQTEVMELVLACKKCIELLQSIALTPISGSVIDYIDLCIENEKSNRYEGFIERIKEYENIKKKYDLLTKMIGKSEDEIIKEVIGLDISNIKKEVENLGLEKKKKKEEICLIFQRW